MLFSLLVIGQISVAFELPKPTTALNDFLAAASIANHAPPAELLGYNAKVETEVSLILRDSLGRERAGQIEQFASSVNWQRGDYAMHVIGYRAQSAGAPFSTLSFLRGWTEPFLYGERLVLGVQFVVDTAELRKNREKRGRDTLTVVHPLASDRDRYYTFSGGDTITTLRAQNRNIPIVRIHVTPHLREGTRLGAFSGEMDLDADRHQIVRMRGQFVVLGKRTTGTSMLARMPGLVAVAYSEFVNAEVDGHYWLPAFQRSEFQTGFVLLGRNRAVMRVVSRFSDFVVHDSALAIPPSAVVGRTRHTTTWAPSDSISAFNSWESSLGSATTSVSADDFDDLAPDAWKPNGRPIISFAPTHFDNLLRYNKIEGLYTGLEIGAQMRDAAPGLTMSADAGWAWTQRTLRGEARASLRRSSWIFGGRAGRRLASTNEFTLPGGGEGGGIGAAIGSYDGYDYVDRRLALFSATHILGSVDRALTTVQVGFAADHGEKTRLTSGLVGGGNFRPNRNADDGSYAFGSLDLEIHPGISGEFVQPGFGATIHHEIASGDLNWQRTELSALSRKYWGPVILALQTNAGVVFGSRIPPQQLFELGGSEILPGYRYKEFAGDRAFLYRAYAGYTLPVLRAPHRIWGNFVMPGLAPGFGTGFQGGWTSLSSTAAKNAVGRLAEGWSEKLVPRETGGVRATFGIGLTVFSGAAHFGVARAVDHKAPWRAAIGFGPSF